MQNPQGNLKIVIADDMAHSREELADAVRQLGHEVLVASGGHEALRLVEGFSPDLLLLDLLMPDLTGFDVARTLRERVTDRWLPVIVLSSMAGDEHFVEALSHGADDYLVRPVSIPLLAAKLKHYCRVISLQSSARNSMTRLQAMHKAIPDAMITVDEAGQVTDTNPAARIFGWLTGGPLPVSLEPGTEVDLQTSAGSMRFGVTAGGWSDGSHSFTTYVLYDLSERLRVERMKDEFLATVSHELRTPLTSMVGALDLISSGAAGVLPEDASLLTEIAHQNGQRLARLIDDVLEVTRLEAHGPAVQLSEQLLNPILSEAVKASQGYASRAGVHLQYECDETLQSEASSKVDSRRLNQVLANLISNALKHSPEGETVILRLSDAGPAWTLSVTDRGQGIPPEFRKRLFERFAQADSSDRRTVAGTGLGLYITQLLVHRMGGEISVASEPGKGAVFTVALAKAGQVAKGFA